MATRSQMFEQLGLSPKAQTPGAYSLENTSTITPQQFTPDQWSKIQEYRSRGFGDQFMNQISHLVDKMGVSLSEATDFVLNSVDASGAGVQGQWEKTGRKSISREEEIRRLGRASTQIGDVATAGEDIANMAAYGAPLARLGIVGKGASAIPMTALAWGAAEYPLARLYGESHEQAIDSSAMAMLFGTGFGALPAVAKGVHRLEQSAQEDMARAAGGGTPPKFDEMNMDAYDSSEAIRAAKDEARFQETAKTRASEIGRDLKHLDNIESMDKWPEIIYKNNPDMFAGMSQKEATAMMLDKGNRKFFVGISEDLADSMRKELDDIAARTEDPNQLVVGAKDDLGYDQPVYERDYEKTELDAEAAFQKDKAVQAASVEAAKKQEMLNTQKANIESRTLDYQKAKSELSDAMKEHDRTAAAFERGDATRAELAIAQRDIDRLFKRLEKSSYNYGKNVDPKSVPTIEDVPASLEPKAETISPFIDEPFMDQTKPGKVLNPGEVRTLHNKLVAQRKKYGKFRPEQGEMSVPVRGEEKPVTSKPGESTVEPAAPKVDNAVVEKDLKQAYANINKRNGSQEKSIEAHRKPKESKPLSGKAKDVREASEPKIGGSEEEAKQAVKDQFKKELDSDGSLKHLSDDEIKELEDMYAKDVEAGIVIGSKSPVFYDTIRNAEKLLSDVKKLNTDIAKPKDGSKAKNWTIDISKSVEAKTYQKMHSLVQRAFDESSRYKDTTIQIVHEVAGGKKNAQLRKQMTKSLLNTDYESIKEFKTKAEASAFMRANAELYRLAQKEINLLADSMKDSKHMNNVEWRANGEAIADKLGLSKAEGQIIDKMASVRAMDDADWTFVEKHQGTRLMEVSLALMAKRTQLSKALFEENNLNRMKGYTSEVFENLDIDPVWRRGALPTELQSKKKGEIINFPKGIDSYEQRIEFARAQGAGIIINTAGDPKVMRIVADEQSKIAKGKVDDFGEVMGSTMAASVKKAIMERQVNPQLIEYIVDKDNGLFSRKPQDGFSLLTKEEKQLLPKELRTIVRYVNDDFKQMLIGNIESGFGSLGKKVHGKAGSLNQEGYNNALALSTMMLKDSVGIFKENVVLKNPVSYANNFMFNFMVGMQNGISPRQMMKYQKEALGKYNELRSLQRDIERAVLLGDKAKKLYGLKELKAKLEANELYQLNKEGMAMSVMSEITSAPSFKRRAPEVALEKGMKYVFGDEVGKSVSEAMEIAMLSPSAFTGKALLNTFTKIDVMGRYAVAKHKLETGGSFADAANHANSVFGDLDKITPVWVQSLSEFGAIPFASWFYRVSAGLGKNMIDNPKKAAAIALALYAAEEMTGRRTESWNPLATMVNTPFDMATMSPILNPIDSAKRVVEPVVYDKLEYAAKREDPSLLLMSRSF